jgi:glyoxylase-like metal-dependent hydrolase (beta-lactamase superfamily II)
MKTTVFPLYEGTFSVGLDKVFRPIERHAKPDKNALRVAIHSFLVKSKQRTFLVDTGLGEFGKGTSIDTLLTHLADNDVAPEDISDIFLSHLHFDHLGGLAHRKHGFWQLTFPYAKIWLSKRELDKILSLKVYYDEEKTEFMWFLHAHADFHYYEENHKPYPEFEIIEIGGHTEFSVAIFYTDSDCRFLMAGDVLPTKGHVNQKFAAKYDFDPKQSVRVRTELAHKALQENRVILAYHSSENPLFRLTQFSENQGFTIEPVQS